jgi:hypothetical protein
MTLIGTSPPEEGSIKHTFAVHDKQQKIIGKVIVMRNPVFKSIMNAGRFCDRFVPCSVDLFER